LRVRFRSARVKGLVEAHPKDFPQAIVADVAFDVANLKVSEIAAHDPIRVKGSPFALAKLGNPGPVVEFNESPLGAFADIHAFWCLHLFDPLLVSGPHGGRLPCGLAPPHRNQPFRLLPEPL
jgi:hypothetical protein